MMLVGHSVLALAVLLGADARSQAVPAFVGEAGPISEAVAATVKQYSWRAGCPRGLESLSYLHLSFWGTDGVAHQGELIVDRALAQEVLAIFRELYDARFPISALRLIDAYQGNDDLSMADNNSSGFNCRLMAGSTTVYSKHSYGRAIDLNPLTNPYVAKGEVMPPGGKAFVDRTLKEPGLIVEGDAVYKAFTSRGWVWGGAWKTMKDYQHFEKKN
jgi:hypothetical protein